MGCKEPLKLLGRYLVRAVEDAGDGEARGRVMWAATLAGIAFGNAGMHAPHAMSVMVNAPSVFRFTAGACPERHLDAAGWLGADIGRGPGRRMAPRCSRAG